MNPHCGKGAPMIRHQNSGVAVIGAGITGITIAYNLARRGCEVTVFDRQPYPAIENILRRWWTALGFECRGVEQLGHGPEGDKMDVHAGSPAPR
ncbi:FAD-dependent oxidoreductase [Bradyrhizobium sp. DOA9]|uniref:FAD-dependent oxidoreductase n=1 Tax=Bradyrhizobium sp. DOA9 TaxID=1126627 RepID=UPI0040401617